MMGRYEMIVAIVAIVMFASVLRARYSGRRDRDQAPIQESAQALHLKEEVKALKERIHVLERIATERENSLAREIEDLRDR